MYYYEVAPTQIIRADSSTFTYSHDSLLDIGQIVNIEVGKKQYIGLILQKVNKPSYPTKSISKVIEKKPLPLPLVKLTMWLAKYYVSPLPNVLQTVLPTGLQKTRRDHKTDVKAVKRKRTSFLFNNDQVTVLETIDKHEEGTFLLQGVTGSGKTAIYIEQAKRMLKNGRSTIVLVPEIALTSQMIAEFSNNFNNLLVTHSKMSEAARHNIWKTALNSTQPMVVIGPRSALFSPLENIGLIIVDEAHEPSYKQEQTLRYSALRAASMLGRFHSAKVIFGSASHNATDRYLAEKTNSPILTLSKVAKANSIPPKIDLIDMTKKPNTSSHRFLSKQLINKITETLTQGKQSLIFHNRRGSASSTLCESCGWIAECPRCFLPMSLHSDKHRMFCHICGFNDKVPTHCPKCNSVDIIHKGVGTKLIEFELKKMFPNANIARFDADCDRDKTIDKLYGDLYSGKIDIAIGTQIVAKGLDLPHLRTVGVIQADTGLAIPDFNANERTFQLLMQVIGRVGRNEHDTNVIVQTYQPSHPSIVAGINQDYDFFYQKTLDERKKGNFPPFTHLAKLTCVYKTEAAAIKNAKKLANEITKTAHADVKVLGPSPAFYEQLRGNYRWQLILKSPKREYLVKLIEKVPKQHWQIELDPSSLL